MKVNARGSDPAHAVSIERNAEIIGDNLETLDGLVADDLAATARIQDLLGKLANANMGAQRLLTPGIRALDGEVAQLRRILADPELSAAERPARVAALAQSIAATAPLRHTQNEFSTINDTLIRAASAETPSDLAVFAHPLARARVPRGLHGGVRWRAQAAPDRACRGIAQLDRWRGRHLAHLRARVGHYR